MVILGKVKKAVTILSDSKYVSPKILGLIRHIASVAGTILIVLGYSTTEEVGNVTDTLINLVTSAESLIGEFLLTLSIIGSWFAKEKQG